MRARRRRPAWVRGAVERCALAALLITVLAAARPQAAASQGPPERGRAAGASGGPSSPVPALAVQVTWRLDGTSQRPRLILTVSPPEGWEVYASRGATGPPARLDGGPSDGPDPFPVSGEQERPLLGRPLEVRGPDGSRLPVAGVWPAPVWKLQPGGRSLVHEGPVQLTLEAPPAALRRVAVRWAICRADRCVPGSTPVTIPARPAPGV